MIELRGRCTIRPDCRPPYRWDGRRCVLPPCTGGKTRVGTRCVCTGNSVEFQGRCVPCPPGKRKVGNRCERIPQPAPRPQVIPLPPQPQFKMIPMQPVCPPGQYWNKDAKRCLQRLR
jgi:hypothetical protein